MIVVCNRILVRVLGIITPLNVLQESNVERKRRRRQS